MSIRWHSAAAAIVVVIAWAGIAAAAEVDTGVIRLRDRAEAVEPDPAPRPPEPLSDARRGFDVQAFDSRFDGLWFQRKAYQAEGREENAVRHAGTPSQLTVTLDSDGLRIAVRDRGALTAGLLDARDLRHGGTGLRVVTTLAQHWDVIPHADGKTVWARFPPRPVVA